MKWFKHDVDSHRDAKLRKVVLKYGAAGYGVYWYCIECIAGNVDQNNITFELEHDAEIIAHDLGLHYELVQELMTYMVKLGLFENNDGVITCMKLAKRLDQSMTSNPEMRKIISRLSDSLDGVMTKSATVMQDKIRLDKNIYNAQSFDQFWSEYPKKKSKGQAEKAFKKLNPSEQLLNEIITALRRAKTSDDWTKDSGKYIPYPATWLNAKGWEDDVEDIDPAKGAK